MKTRPRRFSIGRASTFGLLYFSLNLATRLLFREPFPGKLEGLLFASALFGVTMALAHPYADRLDARIKRLLARR